MHRVKAAALMGMTALVLSGLFAGGAGASVPMQPSQQEWAEHPGMGYEVHCQQTSEESQNSTLADMDRWNAEGRCVAIWMQEPAANLRMFNKTAKANGQAAASRTKLAKKEKKHHRAAKR